MYSIILSYRFLLSSNRSFPPFLGACKLDIFIATNNKKKKKIYKYNCVLQQIIRKQNRMRALAHQKQMSNKNKEYNK